MSEKPSPFKKVESSETKEPSESDEDGSFPEKARASVVEAAKMLQERGESFTFVGFDPESFSRMQAQENEFPGYTTPADEIRMRMETEGCKVVVGDDPTSGNVYVLPAQSSDIRMDGIHPRFLNLDTAADPELRQLILLDRALTQLR